MVAKSFQNLRQLGEPFEESGRMYVKVQTAKGTERKVRYYTIAEYNKLYPDDKRSEGKPARELFGFDKGYITIFKERIAPDNTYFWESEARFHKYWGWYFCSTMSIPEDLPPEVTPIHLVWDEIGNKNGELNEEKEVMKVIERCRHNL